MIATNADAAHKIPTDGSITLTFDRLLLPLSVTRQSVAFRDAFNQAPVSPVVIYDPVSLTVTISSPSPDQPWLLPNQPYKVILTVPKDVNDMGGLRAIDNATLDHPYVIEFFTTSDPQRPPQRPIARTTSDPTDRAKLVKDRAPAGPLGYCDVQPIFLTSCGVGGHCHNATDQNPTGDFPPMGMLLTTAEGIRNTAIGRASEEMNRGASSAPLAPGRRFGENMPIIDPGNPGGSYLIYKLLAHGPATSPAISDDEAALLLWRIAGQAMPPSVIDGKQKPPLALEQAETISKWIAQGARVDVDDCH